MRLGFVDGSITGEFGGWRPPVSVREGLKFCTHSRQSMRMLFLQELNEGLADFAAEVPGRARIARVDRGTQLDRVCSGFGHLESAYLAAPFRVVLDDATQFLANLLDGHRVINAEENRADQIGAAVRPVLKRIEQPERHQKADRRV